MCMVGLHPSWPQDVTWHQYTIGLLYCRRWWRRFSTKSHFCHFQVSYLKHSNGSYKCFDISGHTPVCYLATYFLFLCVSHVQWTLSCFMCHWLRWPFSNQVIPTYQPTSVVGYRTDDLFISKYIYYNGLCKVIAVYQHNGSQNRNICITSAVTLLLTIKGLRQFKSAPLVISCWVRSTSPRQQARNNDIFCDYMQKNNYRTDISGYKSILERVSIPVYCCINGIFCELHHDSGMNIILRPSLSS